MKCNTRIYPMYMRRARQNTTQITKNYEHFTQDERNELSVLLKKGYSLRDAAGALKKSPSSVSREVKRNGVNGEYDPKKANLKARVKRLYSKFQGMKVRQRSEIEAYIHEKMRMRWSPEDIAGRLESEGDFSITAKTIYKYVYGNPFGNPLVKYLKYQGKSWRRSRSPKWGQIIKNRTFIGERPVFINNRERFGDFEADAAGVPREFKTTLAVARERKSRKLFAVKIQRLKRAMDGYKRIFKNVPALSVTFDNGSENSRYEKLGVKTYFCNPYHFWEKGSVENGIGRIREFIPKKTDLATYSDRAISDILDIINNKPMKCLGYRTPNEVFEEHCPIPSDYS